MSLATAVSFPTVLEAVQVYFPLCPLVTLVISAAPLVSIKVFPEGSLAVNVAAGLALVTVHCRVVFPPKSTEFGVSTAVTSGATINRKIGVKRCDE